MVYSVESCRSKSSRSLYQTTTISDSTLVLPTPYGTVAYTGTLAIRPLTSGCGDCDGVLILEFDAGVLNGAYWVNGRSIITLSSVQLHQRKYKVNYFAGKSLYWAAAQFSRSCGSCGCDGCEKIWDVDSTTDTWDLLVESEVDAPNHEQMIPLAFQALKNTNTANGCDDTVEFLDFNSDVKN